MRAMKSSSEYFWCGIKRKSSIFLSFLSSILSIICMAQVAFAEEWTGGDIYVPSGTTLTVNTTASSFQSPSKIEIEQGGTLIIDKDSSLWLGNSSATNGSFSNQGEFIVNGVAYFDPNMTDIKNTGTITVASKSQNESMRMSVTTQQFESILANGKLIIGGEDADYPTRLRIHDEDSDSAPSVRNFTTSQFVTNTEEAANNKIVIGQWARIRVGEIPTEITGDTLAIGPVTYGDIHDEVMNLPENQDLSDRRIAQIRGRNLKVIPTNEQNIFTVTSGMLSPAAGANPSNPTIGQFSSLTIGNNGDGTLSIQGGALTLGSSGNEQGSGTINGNVIIGNDNEKIDSTMFSRAGDWIIKGNLTLNPSGYIQIGGGYSQGALQSLSSNVEVDGKFLMNGGLVRASNLVLNAKQGIEGSESAHIEVPSGTFTVNDIEMKGGRIEFYNPSVISRSFRAAEDTINATQGAIAFNSNKVDARINVGQNSMVTLGSNDVDWLRKEIVKYQTKNNKVWGQDITSALAIRTPQTLTRLGGLNVDGSWTIGGNPATANQARFANNSLFVVDASGIGKKPALSGDGTSVLAVESGAKLLVTDGKLGDTVTITDNFAPVDREDKLWTGNVSSTLLYDVDGELINPAKGTYVVRITDGATPETAFPMLSSEMANIVEQAKIKGLNTNAATPGVRFISRAVDNRYIGANDSTLAAATIESAARIATLGAAPQMTMTANNAAGAAITQRTSFAQPNGILQAVDSSGNYIMESKNRFERNFALWIMPLYQSTNGFGMEAGNFSYDFNGALGGVALGGDYTFDDTFRIGLAFNIGGGYAQGTGDLNKTTNNMNFWGIGAYAGWSQNNFGLTADVNYTSTYNKIKQELPGSMQMGNLKSDIAGNAISTGLRAEYKIQTDYVDIVPHAGFRYTNLFFDSYDAKSGGTVLHGDSFNQNIWTFPIGVSFTKEYAMANDWHVKPLLDLNVTPATGDIKAKTKVRFSGIDQKEEIDTKMMDYITYGGTAGIEFGNETVTIGVDYNGQFGAESSAHGVFGNFRVEF